MNSYKVLERDNVRLAIDLSKPDCEREIEQLQQQGFVIVCHEIRAQSPADAVDAFVVGSQTDRIPLSLYNILFFKTNAMKRRHYIGISLLSILIFIAIIFGVIEGMTNVEDSMSSMGMLVVAGLLGLWLGIGVNVARWKNIGHKGWYYLLAVIVVTMIDLTISRAIEYEFSLAGLILGFYLLCSPENFARRNTGGGDTDSGNHTKMDSIDKQTSEHFNA